jgi:hypothetical protein
VTPLLPKQNVTKNSSLQVPSSPSINAPVIQDLAGGDSSLSEMAVDVSVANADRPAAAPPPQIQATVTEEMTGSSGLSKNGRLLGAFLVIMLISMTIVSGLMYRAAKKEA